MLGDREGEGPVRGYYGVPQEGRGQRPPSTPPGGGRAGAPSLLRQIVLNGAPTPNNP